MTAPVIVRLYEVRDRASVREIACETADKGTPIESFFRDREVAADLLTRYYTDFFATSLWVAESENLVVGYLTGALDPRHHHHVMVTKVVPAALLKAVARGDLFHADTWRLIVSGFKTWRLGGFNRRIPEESYPAHCHINLREGYRGRHVGKSLMEKFIEQARSQGCPGVRAVVRGDNIPSCQFFERSGFQEWNRQKVVFVEGNHFQIHDTIVFVKKLVP